MQCTIVFVAKMTSFQHLFTAILIFSLSLREASSLTFSHCFVLAPGATAPPTDLDSLGFRNKITRSKLSADYCVNHCIQNYLKYAAFQTLNGVTSCYCASERAYERLGSAYHSLSHAPCHAKVWSLKTYVASGDVSDQYVGCYNEVTDPANMASSSHEWIDKWVMSPEECIQYCKNNRADYANLRHGDSCSCGDSFAKHGKVEKAACNTTCAGSKGEYCGGKAANSVYLTLTVADSLKPHVDVHGLASVKVPTTQRLVKALQTLQSVINQKLPNKEAEAIREHLLKGQQLLQLVLDIKAPLDKLTGSDGFVKFNSSTIRSTNLLGLPSELQKFTDVMTQARIFFDRDVRNLMASVNRVSRSAVPLKASVAETLSALKNYFDDDILTKGADRTLQLTQLIISASRQCLRFLPSKEDEMIKIMEDVSSVLVDSPQGIQRYLDVVRKPFSTSAVATTPRPTIDSGTWRGSLSDMAQSWTAFMKGPGVQLYTLLQRVYRTTPPMRFAEMIKTPGNNQAKVDMKQFIEANEEAFKAFKWDGFNTKIGEISRDVNSVQQYLVKAGMSSSDRIKKFQLITNFQYYQSCVDSLSSMVHSVCHTSTTPDDTKVKVIKC